MNCKICRKIYMDGSFYVFMLEKIKFIVYMICNGFNSIIILMYFIDIFIVCYFIELNNCYILGVLVFVKRRVIIMFCIV